MQSNSSSLDAVVPDYVDAYTRCSTDAYAFLLNFSSFIFWLFWRKQQPLKARFYLPLFFILPSIIGLPCSIVLRLLYLYQVLPEDHSSSSYIMLDLTYINGGIALCISVFRFIIMQNLSSTQETFLRMNKMNRKAPPSSFSKRLKVFKFLLSYKFSLGIQVPFFIISSTICTIIVVLIYTTSIRRSTMEMVRIIHLAFVAAVAVGFICSMMLWDLIRNRKQLLKIHQILTRDTLLFRIDVVAAAIAAVLSVVVLAIPSMNPYARLVLTVVRYTMFIGCLGGGTCIVYLFILKTSVICFPQRQAKASPQASSTVAPTIMAEDMYRFISNPHGYQGFREYVVSEFSLENLECWSSIQQLKECLDLEEKSNIFSYIYETFVSEFGVMQTNLNQKTKLECLECYQICKKLGGEDKATHLEAWKAACSRPDFGNNLELDICLNLRDSFSRYNKTFSYRQVMVYFLVLRVLCLFANSTIFFLTNNPFLSLTLLM